MSRILFVLIVFFLSFESFGQEGQGVVWDANTEQPLTGVEIANKRTKSITHSNSEGKFYLNSIVGDTLFFSHRLYAFKIIKVQSVDTSMFIYLSPESQTLDEVEVLSDVAKFKKDSTDNAIIYRKMTKDVERKTQVTVSGGTMSGGVAVEGFITEFARRISGRHQREKRLLKTIHQNQREKFVALRYNAALVKEVIGLDADSAESFIAQNEMPYEFARTASDLEISAWIRELYKNDKK